jgi:Protein of unknown function (DUF3768)
MTDEERKAKIRELNDAARKSGSGSGNRVFLTKGIETLPTATKVDVMFAVANYNDFNEETDPWNEHCEGSFKVGERLICWRVEYYP